MRVQASALSGAVLLSVLFLCFQSVGAFAVDPPGPKPKLWTDHIPTGRPYVKPPLPARPMSEAQLAALATPVVVPPPEPLAVDATRAAILDEITRLKASVDDEPMGTLLDQLGTVYASDLAGPFWIKDNAYTPAARQVVDEMTRADDFALDPAALNIPQLEAMGASGMALGEVRMSLAVMGYAQEAFGARLPPNDISLWLDHKPEVPDAAELLPRLSAAADAAAELRRLHPVHPHFEALREAYLVVTGKRQQPQPKAPPQIPDGPLLKVGDEHPHVALVRQRLDVPAEAGKAEYFDRELGNEIRNYLRRNGKSRRREINDDLRALLNAPPPLPKMPDLKTIQANLLRWRWMPRDLGDIHIWNNIPEFETRLVKNGEVIHRERIIVGQSDQQTPIFSDKMDHIVFKPQWGVPNSIKISDLLPKLRGGDTNVLDRRGMKIIKDGRTIDADRIRWSSVDIRYLNIVQGPSNWNPLGEMKFMFPNRHSVYMHDTTSRHLFSSSERTFSHGCIRVRNPRKLAEVIFTEVQGWDRERIPEYLGRRAEENNRVDFDQPIHVHNVYFTLVPDETGGFRRLSDVYGHDRRVADALAGKSLRSIANNDPARIHKRRIEEIERSSRYDNSSNSGSRRSRYASSDGDDGDDSAARRRGSYNTYRSSLGRTVAPPPRVVSQPSRRARNIQPSWPPQFFFWGN